MVKPPLPIRQEAEQHCALTGKAMLPSALLCFVVDPTGKVVFDLKQDLPVTQRLWLYPAQSVVQRAVTERRVMEQVFSSLTETLVVPQDLPQQVERQLRKHLLGSLHLLRRSGQLVGGFEKVRAWMQSGRANVLVQASDAAEDGRKKLRKLAEYDAVPVIDLLTQAEIASVTGQENQVHLALLPSALTDRFVQQSKQLAAYLAE